MGQVQGSDLVSWNELEVHLADLPLEKKEAIYRIFYQLSYNQSIDLSLQKSPNSVEEQKEILELIALDLPLDKVLSAINQFIQEQSKVSICSVLVQGQEGLRLQVGIAPDLAESMGFKACWSKPISSSNGTVLGLFAMYYKDNDPALEDLELLEVASYLAGIAIERHNSNRLLEHQKHVSEMIARGASLNDILAALVTFIEEFAAETIASIMFLNDDKHTMRFGFAAKLSQDYRNYTNGAPIGAKEGSCGTAMFLKQTVIVEDISTSPLWEGYADIALRNGLKACWSMPILSQDGEVYGSFAMYYKEPRSPGALDLQLLEISTYLASIALERNRFAEAIQASESRYRKISEMTSDYVFSRKVSDEGLKVEWTIGGIQGLIGYTEEEFRGLDWLYLCHPDEMELYREDLPKLLAGHSMVVERRVITKEGDSRWLRLYSRPEWDEKIKKVARILTVAQDISEEKAAEEARIALERRLFEAQKLESLGVLAGGIAHDFNNLLVGILGNAGLALMDIEEAHPAHEIILQIERAAQRAAELTRQMLAYSGKGKFVVQPVNLNSLIEEMTSLLQVSLNKNAVLNYSLDPTNPVINADITQIRQVIMNLIVNASDAIGNRVGSINLSTKVVRVSKALLGSTFQAPELAEGNYILLEVSDNGVGMSPETLKKIFEPFFTTKSTGRGLGLAAVQGIIRGHKGALQVESSVGNGTIFKILLPCLAENISMVEPAKERPQTSQTSGTILVIDDENGVREVVKSSLSRLGYLVLLAEDGVRGLELYHQYQNSIDCVLLDIVMPRMSGQAVYKELVNMNPSVKVILMSGYTEQESIVQFGVSGLKGFIQKPFAPTELQRKLKEALQ